MHSVWLIYLVVAVAFLFDFINGFHDAPNSIATIVATGVLKPVTAVIWAAFFNFIAFIFFHLNVANTIGTGIVVTQVIDPYTILAALLGAISFNLFTWYLGLPSSSSHALIGGLIGAAMIKAGWIALVLSGIFKVLAAIVLSPILGMIIAILFMSLSKHFLREWHESKLTLLSRILQLISSALLSLAHGGNDAQKTMGIIALLLFAADLIGDQFYIPSWVMISCNLVMALGTLAGGWRIVHTLGKKITDLTPVSGACATGSAATVLFVANYLGIPVSTTHTVTGAITGVGSTKGRFGINWAILHRILWAWLFTIPASALVAAWFTWVALRVDLTSVVTL